MAGSGTAACQLHLRSSTATAMSHCSTAVTLKRLSRGFEVDNDFLLAEDSSWVARKQHARNSASAFNRIVGAERA